VHKFHLFFLVFGLNTFFLHAQNEPERCDTLIKRFRAYSASKDRDKAYKLWQTLHTDPNCELTYDNYKLGLRILWLQAVLADSEKRAYYMDEYQKHYDLMRIKYRDKYIIRETLNDYDYKYLSELETYEIFKHQFLVNNANFIQPRALYAYGALAVDLYLIEGVITKKEALDTYNKVSRKMMILKERYQIPILELNKKSEHMELTPHELRRLRVKEFNLKSFEQVIGGLYNKANGMLLEME